MSAPQLKEKSQASLLQLLGTPSVVVSGHSENLSNSKALLLSAYLAYQEDWVLREELLLLLWPDDDEKKARQNLSAQLYLVKKQPWIKELSAAFEAEDDKYRLIVDTDVKQFRDAHGAGDWARAHTTYNGTFLDISLSNLPETYLDWLQIERENLQQSWFESALNYALALEQQKDFTQASNILKQVLKQDPLAEDALQIYLRNLHEAGQRVEANKAFDNFKEQLKHELDMEPLEQTIALMENLRSYQPQSTNANKGVQTEPTSTKEHTDLAFNTSESNSEDMVIKEQQLRNVPSQLTPFIGRDLDLLEIANYLGDSDSRLLTLLGPGGMGKTRLAIQTILDQVAMFEDGAVFVSLAAINAQENNIDSIIQEIIKALDINFGSDEGPKEQLLNYLREKEILVVLDNFEHLLDASGIVTEILEACSKLKIIITSRVTLGFQSEWIYEVKGLDIPNKKDATTDSLKIELHDAAQLFLRRARRVDAGFTLQDGDKHLVSEICSLLGGVPLAIELAVNWLRVLSLEEIVSDLNNSLDLLETSQSDLATRHHSMSGIFEQSWSQLSQLEQDALIKLTVFRGGFSKEASDKVTQIPVRLLLSLSNSSMIYRDETGRFDRHPLVFEFSQEKAEGSSPETLNLLHSLQTEHAIYFADFLSSKEKLFFSNKEPETIQEIRSELKNIQIAYMWIVQSQREDLLAKSIHSLLSYYDAFNMLAEAEQAIKSALEAIDKQSSIYAYLLSYYGNTLTKTGHYKESEDMLKKAGHLFETLEDEVGKTQLAFHLAQLFISTDQMEQALHYLDLCLETYQKRNDDLKQASVLLVLGDICLQWQQESQFELARQHYKQGLELYQTENYQQGIVFALQGLATCESYLGNYSNALEHAEKAYSIQKSLTTSQGLSATLNTLVTLHLQAKDYDLAKNFLKEAQKLLTEEGPVEPSFLNYSRLGIVASETNDLDSANHYFLKSKNLSKHLGSKIYLIYALENLGEVATKQGDYNTARLYFYEGLETIKDGNSPNARSLNLLLEFARLLSKDNELERAYEILFTIRNHPSLKQTIKDKVDKLLGEIELGLDKNTKNQVENECVIGELNLLVDKLCDRYTLPDK